MFGLYKRNCYAFCDLPAFRALHALVALAAASVTQPEHPASPVSAERGTSFLSMYTIWEGYWRSPEELLLLLGTQPAPQEQRGGAPTVRASASAPRPARASRVAVDKDAPPALSKRAAIVSPLRLPDERADPPPAAASAYAERRDGKRGQRHERNAYSPEFRAEPERVRAPVATADENSAPRRRRRSAQRQPDYPVVAAHAPAPGTVSFQPQPIRENRAELGEEPERAPAPAPGNDPPPPPSKRVPFVSPLRFADERADPPAAIAFADTDRGEGQRDQRDEGSAYASEFRAGPERLYAPPAGADEPTARRRRRRPVSKQPDSPANATYAPASTDVSFQPQLTSQKRADLQEEPAYSPDSSFSEDEPYSNMAPAGPQIPYSRPKGRRLKNMHLSKHARAGERDDDVSVSVATESPAEIDPAVEINGYERRAQSRRMVSASLLEVMSVHSDHPAVSSTNALSVNVRTKSRLANGTRRLSPPAVNVAGGNVSSSLIQKPSPGEIVVDRSDGGKLRVIAVPTDGNCGYECLARGVSAALPGPNFTRNDIRRAMQAYVRANKDSVQELVNLVTVGDKCSLGQNAAPSLDVFDKEILKRGMSGHWLGSCYGIVEIMIASKAVGMSIELYAAEPLPILATGARESERHARTVRPYERVGSGANVIRLLFQGKSSAGHFSLLLPT